MRDQNDKAMRYPPTKSFGRLPKNSPRIVTFVPGGPSFGDKPVTTGGGAIGINGFNYLF